MTHRLQKIIFFGTEDFSGSSLQALLDADFSIAAVVTKPDSRSGRGQKLVAPAVKTIAQAHNIPVWQPEKLREITDQIHALQPVTGVLVSYGKIVPQSIIDLFTPGIINVHPSPLPKYRGPSPIESAIINGDRETGITIMQLSAAMDAGPIYGYTPLALTGHDTQPDLYAILADLGAQTLSTLLPDIMSGVTTALPQDDTEATYCQLLKKEDAWIDPDAQTAAAIERQIRAYLTFPKTKTRLLGHDIIITKGHVADTQTGALDILCHDGRYLCIDELIAPSGKKMNAEAFIRGYTA